MAKVLVVDDEDAVRETVCEILLGAGHETVEARDGREALDLLGRLPDLEAVLLDLHMPRMDGTAVLDALENGPVVIVYSAFAHGSMDDLQERYGPKVYRFVQKPALPEDLLNVIDSCLAAS